MFQYNDETSNENTIINLDIPGSISISNNNRLYSNWKFKQQLKKKLKKHTLSDLILSMDFNFLYSHIYTFTSNNLRDMNKVPLLDFF